MEYVGRRVKKEVRGHGTLSGEVRAHEPATGTFRVVYDGGSSEDLDFAKVSLLLVPSQALSPQALGSGDMELGSNPEKRRCIGYEGKDGDSLVFGSGISDSSVDRDGGSNFDLNLNKRLDLSDDACNNLNDDDDNHGIKSVRVGPEMKGLDLNQRVNLELAEECRLKDGVAGGSLGAKKEMIDLNLDVNEGFENLGGGRAGRCFDLNLKFMEDEVINSGAHMGRIESNGSVCAEECEQLEVDFPEDGSNGNLIIEGVGLVGDDSKANLVNVKSQKGNFLTKEHDQLQNCAMEVGNGDVAPLSSQKKRRGRKKKDASKNNIEAAPTSPKLLKVNIDTIEMDIELESTKETPLRNGNDVENGVLGTVTRGRRGRKRKAVQQGCDIALSTPEIGLRRSSRRAKLAAASEPYEVPDADVVDEINHQLSSPAISVVSDEKIIAPTHGKFGDHDTLPPKVELPPSSCDLDLNGVSMFDVVSVYSFLRSFSTSLFLSPFELDVFVTSVKSSDSTLLFDSIHVSLLRTLRKHLESLSEEGCVSSSNCLRFLNWDFLDVITWPMFLVEYLLLHSPGHIPGFVVCQLSLFYDNYYKLPMSAKVDILRHLCDDVLEVESFRSEINKRTLATEQQTNLERSMKFNSSRKRKATMDAASNSCITEEDVEDPLDWNSDECYLCKMDGNLICCDGCPAAFHSRCVGVVSSQLPEGEWYCPECVIEKDMPYLRTRKVVRGAELLGVDPCGRVYYSSCSYLLVLEQCNDKYLSRAYNRNDLPTLIEALESSPFINETILNAICKQWNIVRGVSGPKNDLDARSSSIQSAFSGKSQLPEMRSASSENKNGSFVGERSVEKLVVRTNSSNTEPENAKCITVVQTGDLGTNMGNHLASSEGSGEVSQMFTQIDTLKRSRRSCSKRCSKGPDQFHTSEKLANDMDQYMTLTSVNVEKGKNISSESYSFAPDTAHSRELLSQVYHAVNYVNSYEFARTASSFYEEWICKSSDKTSQDTPRSAEEIVARQLKFISNKFAEFSWANIKKSNNLRKESCGWCFYCRVPEEERDCLFIMNGFPAIENYACEILGIQLRKSIKNHLVDVMCHIICIEDHLQGLLSGPWLNQHYSMLWRKSVLEVADITSLKYLLLKLESNLHHLVFSADWQKHVDAVATMGSACHVVSSSARLSSKHGIGRKRANPSKVETSQSSSAATGLSLFWWRGGRGSQVLFNWKVLPHRLASKAARQGGCKKIPGILYAEGGEYAKRTKCTSWRAAVETSRSIQQLALQVRELDANIRWDDIGNTNILLKMDKDSRKPARSFKKVIIRRKCSEGGMVKYLLDFGKRRFVPDIVVRHGSIFEDLSSNRKKYWLEESHVPLHLLKSFEGKRIARKSNVVKSGKLRDSIRVLRKSFKGKGFSYLFSRAERSENYQCGHCKKDVLIREAVSCEHCEGFFHRRHVKKSAGSFTAGCTYTCHKCQTGKFVKIDIRKWKSESTKQKKNATIKLKPLHQGKGRGKGKRKGKQPANPKKMKKAPVVIPLRRSARNAAAVHIARISFQSAKVKKGKRGRKPKSAKSTCKKPKNFNWKKKRTPVNSSFWLNGLWLSRRPNNAKLIDFRSRMLVLPGEATSVHDNPTCSLCGELEHKSELIYVACEICRAWFHGDVFNLTADRIENIIGFKCHTCLKRRRPDCPHHSLTGNSKPELASKSNTESECIGEEANCLARIENRLTDQMSDSNDEAKTKFSTVNMEEMSLGTIRESDQRDGLSSAEKILPGDKINELGEEKGLELTSLDIE